MPVCLHVRVSQRAAVVAALTLFAVPAAGWAQAPLTLAEALRLAESRAPTLSAADAGARSAREMAVAAGQLPDPVLRAGVDNVPVTGSDAFSLERDFMTMRRIGVMQEYVSTTKRVVRQERSEREAQRWEAEREMSRAEVRTEVAMAWFDRLYARRTEQLLQGLADEVGMQERATEAQLVSGKSSAADVLTTRALHVQALDRVTNVRRQQQVATARLARWLSDDASRPPADELALPSDAQVLALAAHDLHDIPHVRALAGQVDLANADVKVAEQNRSPNWSWEVAYAQRGPAYSNMISVGVSVPLPIARRDRQDREVAARLAQRDQARELLEDARKRHRAEFSAMRIAWQALRERKQRLESTLLPVARQRIEATLAAYGGGQQNLAAVLEARRADVDARVQILELEREAAQLWARLRYVYLEAGGTGQ